MKINYNGKEILVEVIGGFSFNNKEYAVCAYMDVDTQKIVIVETYNDETGKHTRDIPPEEIDGVLEQFNHIKEELMEDKDGEAI